MDLLSDPVTWGQAEFGHADLGDARRVRRLVAMVTQFALTPGGTVTAVFSDDADREGAYDWLENDHVSAAAVAAARDIATARRCRGLPFVFVPTDGSSITITDRTRAKGTGRLGAGAGRGDKVHSALAIAPDGTPLGICAQHWWTRPDRRTAPARNRPPAAKETQHWLDVRAQTRAVFRTEAPAVQLWFQHDREADAWPVLLDAAWETPGAYTTVRAAWDRRLVTPDAGALADPATASLRGALAAAGACGRYALQVPAGPTRAARDAVLEVRFATVTLDLYARPRKGRHAVPLYAVVAREITPVPRGERPIEWLLLTTYPVTDFDAACLVLFGYTQRWRIEEFHKAWKTACCNLQDSQLGAHDHRVKWGTLGSAVAMRLLRLTYLARTAPATPATTEFTPDEIDAMRDLRPRRTLPPTAQLTLAAAVLWVAQIGGYTGPASGGPPGMGTLARGLGRIAIVALAARNRRVRTAAVPAQDSAAPVTKALDGGP